jgi:hypothetical protein
VSYNENAEAEYHVVVYKKQRVRYGSSGYVALYDPLSKKLSVVFNDLREKAYINHSKTESVNKELDAVPVIVSIDSTGYLKKKVLFDNNKATPVLLCPSLAVQCAVNAVEIWGRETAHTYRAGKLVIAE